MWAPTGSRLPKACPTSGFVCPGAADDDVNDPPGSEPIIVPVGGVLEEVREDIVAQDRVIESQIALDDGGTSNLTEVKYRLSLLYNVPVAAINLAAAGGDVDTDSQQDSGSGSGESGPQRRRLATTTYTLSIDPSLVGGQASSSVIVQQMQGVNESQLLTAIGVVARIVSAANVTSALVNVTITVTRQRAGVCPAGHWVR